MDFESNDGGAGWTPYHFNEIPIDPPDLFVISLPNEIKSPAAAVVTPTYKAVHLGSIETPVPFPEAGQLESGEFRRETDRVMTYLENVSKSTSEKGALKSKVLVTLTSDNVFEARPAAKGRGSIITVARPLDDVMAYRAGLYKIRGKKRHTAVLLLRSDTETNWRDGANMINCHRFIFKTKLAQANFFGDLQNGFRLIGTRMVTEKKEEKLRGGRPKGITALRSAWG